MRLFRGAHHPDSFTGATHGGLQPPPAERLWRAKPPSLAQHRDRRHDLLHRNLQSRSWRTVVGEPAATVLEPAPVQEPDLNPAPSTHAGAGAEAGVVRAVITAPDVEDPVEVEHDAPDTDPTDGRVPPGEEDASTPGPDAPAPAETNPGASSGAEPGASPTLASTADAPAAVGDVLRPPLTLSEDQKIIPDLGPAISNPDITRTSGASGGEDTDVRQAPGPREPAARPRARRTAPRAASPAVMDDPLF